MKTKIARIIFNAFHGCKGHHVWIHEIKQFDIHLDTIHNKPPCATEYGGCRCKHWVDILWKDDILTHNYLSWDVIRICWLFCHKRDRAIYGYDTNLYWRDMSLPHYCYDVVHHSYKVNESKILYSSI